MYYLLYFLKDKEGAIDPDRKVRRFETPDDLLEFVDQSRDQLEVERAIKTEKEFEIAWKANLTELSFTSKSDKPKRKKRGPYKKRRTPEEILENADKVIEGAEKTLEKKCSKCNAKIAVWNKTGICSNCQQGKKTKKDK